MIHSGRRAAGWPLLIVALGALGGCGKSGGPGQAPLAGADPRNQPAVASGGATPGDASAEQVAKEARADLDCPAKIATTARQAGAPVDDIQGVRPGLTYEEAWNAVLCTNGMLVASAQSDHGFNINTYGQKLRQGFNAHYAAARVTRTGRQIVQEMEREASARGMNAVRHDLDPGQSRWLVDTMGLPGQERVLSVAHRERFPAGGNPSAASTQASLVQKYGTPSHLRDNGPDAGVELIWEYDTQGHLVPDGSQLYSHCWADPDPDAGLSVNPDCTLGVYARLKPVRGTPGLVDVLDVKVVALADGYRLVTQAEAQLKQQDQQRQAQAVESASKDVKAPSL